MPLYECVFIARNDITQQQVEAIAEQVATLIAEGGGEVKKREYWGLRGLAYKVKKNRKGHYMLLGIDAPGTALPEVERWVLTWGADAEVVHPKELRYRLRATAATLLERYR